MKKELTTKQQTFLDHLVETGGDPKEAAKLAGYAENGHWQVAHALKTLVLQYHRLIYVYRLLRLF